MRISDWSSDVCSSDLPRVDLRRAAAAEDRLQPRRPPGRGNGSRRRGLAARAQRRPRRAGPAAAEVSGCRCRSAPGRDLRSEEHTSELQSLMRISYAVFCLKKKKQTTKIYKITSNTS